MDQDLVVRQSDEIGIIVAPNIVLENAMTAAKALMEVVSLKKKPVIMNGEQYLEYEDWQTVGQFYGYTAKTGDAGPVEIDGVKGAKAHADLVNFKTGEIVGGAEAYCMRDEEKWNTRPKYEWQGEGDNRKRVKIGDEVVPWFQLASMAQTRAGAKAFRNRLAWVVVLAGYRPTPAEEMTEGTVSSAVDERRTVDKASHYCTIHNVNFFKSGKMRGYAHKIEGTTEWCNEPEPKKAAPDKVKPEPEIDKRGENEKEGRDVVAEVTEKVSAEAKAKEPPPPATEQVLHPETEKEAAQTSDQPPQDGFIDLGWLQEQLVILQGKKLAAWTNTAVVKYLNTTTGKAATRVSAAVKELTKEQAVQFTKKVTEAIEMA